MNRPKRHHWWPRVQPKQWTATDGLIHVVKASPSGGYAVRLLMAMSVVAIPTVSLAAFDGATLAGSYLCVAKSSGGLIFDRIQNQWFGTAFNTENKKFVVKLSYARSEIEEGPRISVHFCRVEVKMIGEDNPFPSCFTRLGFIEVPFRDGIAECFQSSISYIFDFKELKYQQYFSGGYMDRRIENTDTPLVEIGNCVKL